MRKRRLKDNDVVILAARRSPIGKFGKGLKDWSAPQLAGPVISQVMEDASINPSQVDRLIMGHALPAGVGQNAPKQAAFKGGLLKGCIAESAGLVCASSLKALRNAHNTAIVDDELIVAGGMESMSQAPYVLKRSAAEGAFGHKRLSQLVEIMKESGRDINPLLRDSMVWDGLTDAYDTYAKINPHMAELADRVACDFPSKISRKQQDEYAFESHRRAHKANSLGAKILGVCTGYPVAGISYPISKDEGVREPNLEKIQALQLAFGKTITAGNASQLSDGAAALIVSTYRKARMLDREPIARIVSFGEHSKNPELYPTAPVDATIKVLRKCKMHTWDIDLFEVNEAFAVVPLYYMAQLPVHVSHDKLNIWGGAIALGHPIGASGARIVVTLIHALRHTGGRYGLATACYGGGGAIAVIIENLAR